MSTVPSDMLMNLCTFVRHASFQEVCTYMNCYCYTCPVKLTQRDTMHRTQVAFCNTYSTLPTYQFPKRRLPNFS